MASIEDFYNQKTFDAALARQDKLLQTFLENSKKQFEEDTKNWDKRSKRYRKELEARKKIEEEFEKKILEKKDEIEQQYFEKLTILNKKRLLQTYKDDIESKKAEVDEELAIYREMQETLGKEFSSANKERLEELEKSSVTLGNIISRYSKSIKKINDDAEESDNKLQKKRLKRVEEREKKEKRLAEANLKREKELLESKQKLSKDLDNAKSRFEQVKILGSFATSQLKDSYSAMKGETGWQTAKNIGFEAKTNLANIGDNIVNKLSEKLGSFLESGLNQINVAIEDVTSHRTKIMARLQDEDGEYDYSGLLNTIAKNLAASPYITQKAFMQKLDDAVDKGIAYNVEQRAFLNTIKDDIATTFDAFDSNLMRIIRLQQADSTAARLGMEAALTKTFNTLFSDTSYLSDMYDSVTAAIVDAESLMTRSAATEFEYVVQKWMGSLYSLGASNELINQIAQGLNYIGTGNVQALSNNSSLQTLFAMSASRAQGVDYADLLVGGLTTSKTNELLKSMVEYLKEIAEENKNNNVIKSAYGGIYNMSLADMRAITSLSSDDISSIYSQNISYSDMQTSLNKQLNSITKRLSVGEMINNVFDNFLYSTGSEIAQNAATYTLWQITDLIENATNGIHLPAVSVFGNMVDLSSFTIEGMMKTGIVGLSTLGQIGNIISSISSGGGLNLNAWGYKDKLERGQIETQSSGSINSTSGGTYVSSNSSSDMKKSSISGATDDSKEVADITNKGMENEYSFDDWYKAVLLDHDPIYVKPYDIGYIMDDFYRAVLINHVPIYAKLDDPGFTMDDFYKAVLVNHDPLFTFSMNSTYSLDDIYKSILLEKNPISTKIVWDEYSIDDLYKTFFVNEKYIYVKSAEDITVSDVYGFLDKNKSFFNQDKEDYTISDIYKALFIDNKSLLTRLSDKSGIYRSLFTDRLALKVVLDDKTSQSNSKEYTMTDVYKSFFIDKSPIVSKLYDNNYPLDTLYSSLFIDGKVLKTENSKKYVDTDIYKAIFKDNSVVPVTVSKSSDLGLELSNLVSKLGDSTRVSDVNIKSSSITVPSSIKFDESLKEQIKLYISSTYIDMLASAMKDAIVGQSKGINGATIANVCEKIMNDKIDVDIKNNNFDTFLDIQSSLIF